MQKQLTPLLREARNILTFYIKRIDDGECNEDDIGYILEKTNAESKGYFKEDSFMTYDKAMKTLGISKRNDLKSLMDRFKIKSFKINNRSVGFPSTKVHSLALKLRRKDKDVDEYNKRNGEL